MRIYRNGIQFKWKNGTKSISIGIDKNCIKPCVKTNHASKYLSSVKEWTLNFLGIYFHYINTNYNPIVHLIIEEPQNKESEFSQALIKWRNKMNVEALGFPDGKPMYYRFNYSLVNMKVTYFVTADKEWLKYMGFLKFHSQYAENYISDEYMKKLFPVYNTSAIPQNVSKAWREYNIVNDMFSFI